MTVLLLVTILTPVGAPPYPAPGVGSIAVSFSVLSNRSRTEDLADYEALVLPAPIPLTNSVAYGIGSGQIAGTGRITDSAAPDETHAVEWPAGGAPGIDLNPPGFVYSAIFDTDGQQQVGHGTGAATGFARHALIWSGDPASYVDLHPGGIWSDSIARATAGGQQVGNINSFYQGDSNSTFSLEHAALWSGSAESVVDLHPPFDDCDRSWAEDTDGAQQVGYGHFDAPEDNLSYRALLWKGSADSAVILHPTGFTHSFAQGVSGGEQVGWAFDALGGDGYDRALLWHGSAESVVSLHPDGYLWTSAYATNGSEQVGLGGALGGPFGVAHALKWSGTAESVVDLHAALPAEFGEGSSLAYGIDAEGNIAGFAQRPDGTTMAVLWRHVGRPRPTPTPTTPPPPTPTPAPAPGAPAVSSIEPASGSAAGGTEITLSGKNFLPGLALMIGGIPATEVEIHDLGNLFGSLTARTPALAPGTLNDVTIINAGGASGTLSAGWFADFSDVPQSDAFHDDIEAAFRSRVTAGCGGGRFCPGVPATRAQMAILLLKARHGPLYQPPPASGAIFADVPATAFAAAWIEELFAERITAGCAIGAYCPNAFVSRAQAAPLLLKAEHGTTFRPPQCRGVFADVPCLPIPAFAVDWIEELSAEEITAGCGARLYCPTAPVLRGQMAAFLRRTFGLR